MTAMATELDLEPGLSEALWQAWLTLELPEGFRAEIIEGFIDVSPTGRRSHARIANRLRDALVRFLEGTGFASFQDLNVLHGHQVYIPDLVIGPEDLEDIPDPDGWGVDATRVSLVAEVVSPGHDGRTRDLIRKRRCYARAGVPVYVIIDDYDGLGHVSVLTDPDPQTSAYLAEVRMPYGTPVTIPEGPAKGFVIDTAVTGEPRGAE
ncbi:Uma2 family endonuclease [Kitasatospora acidiphila]|uniref:Uma2 family endonuclease n=1 Tax=Kitasatospora acidiphila TaxID=2567942 RepID=A0A540W322_9ACTN|nr:Uma2 family endonuclease [Kitasatospora acidiphila]TQF03426.1 Uma2 family endonuclease [Kitasatospora acidiphila]